MKPAPVLRLSAMMFLQYAIWGAWLPILWPFLADHRGLAPEQIGNLFAVGAIGAILAPFVAGQIADRFFATERFLGASHLLGAVPRLAAREGRELRGTSSSSRWRTRSSTPRPWR
jgi:MFS family permease